MPTLSIERRLLTAQPALSIRRRISRQEIATTLGECYGKIAMHCHQNAIALAGRPFARYPEMGAGLITIEPGMPIATAVESAGEIECSTLPGGYAAVAVHAGPYDELAATYAGIERWVEANGHRLGGPPWESYITDPAEFPDPAHWRTEVYWPLD